MNFLNDLDQKKARRRILFLTLFISLWILGLALRLIQLQVISHSRFRSEAIEQSQNIRVLIPKRGTIFDRNGKILARSIPMTSVFYQPFKKEPAESRKKTILNLRDILSLTDRDIEKIKKRIEKKDRFIWVKRKIDAATAKSVKRLDLSGVFTQRENKRYYPLGTLAAHILGGVSIDDAGLSGIELRYNSTLQGKKGEYLILKDAKKREYHIETIKEAEPGKDITLTIDETIQYIAEQELKKAVLDNSANWGTVIISHPFSGEILALASYPTYDPNHYPPSPESEMNRAIRFNFEPGSTFKIITASAALENRSVGLNDAFDCRAGLVTQAGRPIRDHKLFGILSFPEVFIHSSNVGTIKIGQKVGENALYEAIKSFRFGLKTGIDLPAEESGIFLSLNSWSVRSLASVSIGYEISVTAIQILQAVNIIANHGYYLPPRIVREISGSPPKIKKSLFSNKPVTSKEAASELISILERVVQEGTGQAAQVEGYTIAGKTGTTQKFDSALGAYSNSRHLASFVGFVPVERPAFSMIVVLDEPKKTEHYGGQVAAPVFREIASRVLRYLHIFPQRKQPSTLIAAKNWREN